MSNVVLILFSTFLYGITIYLFFTAIKNKQTKNLYSRGLFRLIIGIIKGHRVSSPDSGNISCSYRFNDLLRLIDFT